MTWRSASGNERYEGGFREGRKHGRGVFTGVDGERTVGEWREGKRRESERRVSERVASVSFGARSAPTPTYEGELQDGKPHGQGVMSWTDGRCYEGNFRDGHLDSGVLTWPDGRRYKGDFFRGYLSGDGVMTWPDGRRIEGEWIEDRFQGSE